MQLVSERDELRTRVRVLEEQRQEQLPETAALKAEVAQLKALLQLSQDQGHSLQQRALQGAECNVSAEQQVSTLL